MKTTIGICARCRENFEFRSTTRPRKYCLTCGPVVALEVRTRNQRDCRKRRKQRLKSSKIVRYAGFDPNEKPLQFLEESGVDRDTGVW